MQISYRKMTTEDAAAVENVEKQCFKMPWSREAFWEEAAKSDAYYIVAIAKTETKEQIVAYIGIWLIFNEGHITNVAVAPEYRGHGIGKALLEKIIAVAQTRGVEAITLEVRPSNTPALRLYNSFGFKSSGRRPHYYLDNGEDAEIMWLTCGKKDVQDVSPEDLDATLTQIKDEINAAKKENAPEKTSHAGQYI